MKAARPTSLTFAAMSCALLLPVASGACGTEDLTPPVDSTTGGVAPTAGTGTTGGISSAGTGVGTSGTTTTMAGSGGATSTAGSGGATSTAGSGGATSMAGSGGATSTAGTGGTATTDDSAAVGAPLTGHTILMPCNGSPAGRVCTPKAAAATPCKDPGGFASSYSGTHSHNEQITLGGTPGKRYIVRVRIQGEVEAKTYNGGVDANNAATLPANGLYTGGTADNSGNAYNIYFIRTDSPKQHYYLNQVRTSNDTRVRHSTFPMDYEFDMEVEGGSTVCLVSADPNNSAIKNCAEPDDGSNCTGGNTVTVANLDPLTAADIGAQPYNGQFVGVTVVKTTPKP
jgi:hypothetical protein